MNYLAHIHLAHLTQTSLVGNFLGDFVKGSDLSKLPSDIELGVRLHRAIDSFTDQHPLVRSLKRTFPKNIRRMSGVVIDIYFDHLLCRDWQLYNKEALSEVLDTFYTDLKNTEVVLNGRFTVVKNGLLEYKWLHQYAEVSATHRAYHQIEKRLNYRIEFADLAVHFISLHKDDFVHTFTQFYPELVDYCYLKA